MPIRFANLQDYVETKPPELDYVVLNILAGTVGAIVGPGGASKTYLAEEIAVSVATGYDVTGGALQIKHSGPVLYLQAEDPVAVNHQRFHTIGQYLSPADRLAMYENLSFAEMYGLNVTFINEALRPTAIVDEIKELANGVRLVIFDTLRRFHLLDENDSGHMAAVIGVMENIARETGSTVLFVHHANKLALVNDKADMQQAIRGSSTITDNIRWQGNLISKENKVRLITSKNNYGPPCDDIWLERRAGGMLLACDPPPPEKEDRKPSRSKSKFTTKSKD